MARAISARRRGARSLVLSLIEARHVQLSLEQRQLVAIITPLRDGGVVQRPPHLCSARGSARRGVAVKIRAGVLPFESAELEQPAHHPAAVRDQLLVAELVDCPWECLGPVTHETAGG